VKITSAVSVRNGPSASADIIGKAYAGARARITSRHSDWSQIVDPASGNTGWVHSSVLMPIAHYKCRGNRRIDERSTRRGIGHVTGRRESPNI
jgi:uncharacterized protein YraI